MSNWRTILSRPAALPKAPRALTMTVEQARAREEKFKAKQLAPQPKVASPAARRGEGGQSRVLPPLPIVDLRKIDGPWEPKED